MGPILTSSVRSASRAGVGVGGYPRQVLLGEGNHPGKPLKAKQASSGSTIGAIFIFIVVVVNVVVDGTTTTVSVVGDEDEYLLSHHDLTGRK